jgi:hypothetical protein
LGEKYLIFKGLFLFLKVFFGDHPMVLEWGEGLKPKGGSALTCHNFIGYDVQIRQGT